MRPPLVQLAPSMMCADPFALKEVVELLKVGGIEWLHIDVMDGRYVPNFTLGPDYCRFLARVCTIPFDVHLMVEQPERHIQLFTHFPGVRISFHPETVRQPVRLIESIREAGASPGIAIDPGLTTESCACLLPLVDQVTVMTVSPGFAGQKMLSFCLPKVGEVKALRARLGLSFSIQVDGNVSWGNIPAMVRAGADSLVLGTSSLFEKGTIQPSTISRIRALIAAESSVSPAAH